MKEYWVNTYAGYKIGQFYTEKIFCEAESELLNIKLLYRIRVRLK
jgi:hypothetical protein